MWMKTNKNFITFIIFLISLLFVILVIKIANNYINNDILKYHPDIEYIDM